jgi:hypothetical protein
MHNAFRSLPSVSHLPIQTLRTAARSRSDWLWTERLPATRASELAAKVIDTLTPGNADVEAKAKRKHRLIKGLEEFREARVDRTKK